MNDHDSTVMIITMCSRYIIFPLGKYIAWESQPMNAEQYFEAVPAEMVPKYTFFNTKISSDPKDKMYPWNFLWVRIHLLSNI